MTAFKSILDFFSPKKVCTPSTPIFLWKKIKSLLFRSFCSLYDVSQHFSLEFAGMFRCPVRFCRNKICCWMDGGASGKGQKSPRWHWSKCWGKNICFNALGESQCSCSTNNFGLGSLSFPFSEENEHWLGLGEGIFVPPEIPGDPQLLGIIDT